MPPKNPLQFIRDLLPQYPGCIRTIFAIILSIILLGSGMSLVADGRPSNYIGYEYVRDTVNGGYRYTTYERGIEAEKGKLAGGILLIIIAIPLFLSGIFYYFKKGCGYNRFYTNNLVKFEGGAAVKRARKNRKY